MEFDPTKKSEGGSGEEINDGGLSKMPSYEEFDKMRAQGNLPDGVRDEQDYREYVTEKQAYEAEAVAAEQKIEAEKIEKIGTFEKRLEMNKGLYDDVAWSMALYVASDPKYNSNFYANSFTQKFRDLQEMLYEGVADDDISNTAVLPENHKSREEDKITLGQELAIKNDHRFDDVWRGYMFWSLTGGKSAASNEESEKKAKAITDTSKYERDFKHFLEDDPESITGYDISGITDRISHLNYASGSLFNFTKDRRGSYSHTYYLPEEDPIIPTLEARLRLEEQIMAVREKIAEVASQVYARELQETVTQSTQGSRVAKRLEKAKESAPKA